MPNLPASLANRHNFRMRRRIIRRRNAIRRLRDNLAASSHHRRKRPAAPRPHILDRKRDRPFHAPQIHILSQASQPLRKNQFESAKPNVMHNSRRTQADCSAANRVRAQSRRERQHSPVGARLAAPSYELSPRHIHARRRTAIPAQAIIPENDSTFLLQNNKSATPIKISAKLNPIHNPAAPHPTAKHK